MGSCLGLPSWLLVPSIFSLHSGGGNPQTGQVVQRPEVQVEPSGAGEGLEVYVSSKSQVREDGCSPHPLPGPEEPFEESVLESGV